MCLSGYSETHTLASFSDADVEFRRGIAREQTNEREKRRQKSEAAHNDANAACVAQIAKESHEEVPQEEATEVARDDV